MSRVGKVPVVIPNQVKVLLNGLEVTVSGPKGELKKIFKGEINIALEDNRVLVTPLNKHKQSLAMWGTARSIIQAMIKGVTEGFVKELEVKGVGYKAIVSGKYLNLTLGKSHNTKVEIPEGIIVTTPKQNAIILIASNNEKLGQFIALIKSQRPVEPYKGKGIVSKGEYVERKEGKKK